MSRTRQELTSKTTDNVTLAYVHLGKAPINITTTPGTLSGDYSTNEAWFLTVAIDLH